MEGDVKKKGMSRTQVRKENEQYGRVQRRKKNKKKKKKWKNKNTIKYEKKLFLGGNNCVFSRLELE